MTVARSGAVVKSYKKPLQFQSSLADPGSTKTLIRRPSRFIDWADERISANVCGREAQTVSG